MKKKYYIVILAMSITYIFTACNSTNKISTITTEINELTTTASELVPSEPTSNNGIDYTENTVIETTLENSKTPTTKEGLSDTTITTNTIQEQTTTAITNKKPEESTTTKASEPTTNTTSHKPGDNTTQLVASYEETMLPYEGKWFLKGYSDVYITIYNIYESGGWAYFDLSAYNFALPLDSGKTSPIAPYTIYPYENFIDNPTEDFWSNGFNVLCDPSVWPSEIEKHNMQLGTNCIFLGGKQFVREKGNISMYDDTCYKEALGHWYMEDDPNTSINIWKRQNLEALGDYIEISMWNFNIDTLTSNGNNNIQLYAARKNNWDKYGIQVNNGVLTISNANGTKKFYRNAIEISGNKNIELSIGQTKKIPTIVIPDTVDQSVTWTSTNTSVATINGNIVKAVGKGTATLTVTSKVGGRTATCTITVTEPPLTAYVTISDGIQISGSNIYSIITASASINGGSGNYTTCILKLYHNGTLVSKTNNLSITTPKQSGEYTIEVYIKDSSGNEATATTSITY